MAYIMSVNANIIADTGGPCSTADCTVSKSLLTGPHGSLFGSSHRRLHVMTQGVDKSEACKFFDPGYEACVVRRPTVCGSPVVFCTHRYVCRGLDCRKVHARLERCPAGQSISRLQRLARTAEHGTEAICRCPACRKTCAATW